MFTLVLGGRGGDVSAASFRVGGNVRTDQGTRLGGGRSARAPVSRKESARTYKCLDNLFVSL